MTYFRPTQTRYRSEPDFSGSRYDMPAAFMNHLFGGRRSANKNHFKMVKLPPDDFPIVHTTLSRARGRL